MIHKTILASWVFVLLLSCISKEKDNQTPNIIGIGYDRHVELRWNALPGVEKYKIFASSDGENFTERATVADTIYMDFVNDLGSNLKLIYKIVGDAEDSEIGLVSVTTKDFNDEELLDMVQYYTFRYFWEGAEPTSGLAAERIHIDGEYPYDDAHIVTTGGTGFGLFGILTGIEREWITRHEGVARLEKIVNFLESADRFHGIWPHWIDGQTGKVSPFDRYDNGADLVESAFLMQGLLAVQQYLDTGDAQESAIRDQIQKLWEEMNWKWHTRNSNEGLYWHWSPDYEWEKNFIINGYDECLITYVLAASSPTHSISADCYFNGWARGGKINGNTKAYGYNLELAHNASPNYGGPLFWAHYSYHGLNPKGLKDRFTSDYFEQNKNHTLINRGWSIENPEGHKGYGEDLWGLSASYSLVGYEAHKPENDLGVISPTAALSSFPYTPKESMAVLKNLYYNYGHKVFGRYGFYDALSPEHDYYPQRYLAIDQGPIVAMIENHRSGLGWKLFMQNEDVRKGLRKLGFEGFE